ncbi:MAG TPA: hypothetical protein VF329_00065 [Gammaproteobacteria bacterium]
MDKKRRYPFVIGSRFGRYSDNTPRGPGYAVFMIAMLFAVFWVLDGTLRSGAIAALAASIFFGIVLAPHALAKTRNTAVKVLATAVMGTMALAGLLAGLALLYLLVFVRPGTGDVRYFFAFLMAVLAPGCLWLAYGYAFQIHYYWSHPPDE